MNQHIQPRLVKGLQAEYIPAEYGGANASGLKVYGKNVLVMMDVCGETTGGGILMPLDMQEKMTEAAESGAICGLGPEAFSVFDDGTRWHGDKPQVGDRVYVEKYAGLLARGADGKIYRIMDYRCVAAGLET